MRSKPNARISPSSTATVCRGGSILGGKHGEHRIARNNFAPNHVDFAVGGETRALVSFNHYRPNK